MPYTKKNNEPACRIRRKKTNRLAVAGVEHLPEDFGPLRALEVVLFGYLHSGTGFGYLLSGTGLSRSWETPPPPRVFVRWKSSFSGTCVRVPASGRERVLH